MGIHVRSGQVGAAAAFDLAVDWDDVSSLGPYVVDVLSSWIWEDGEDACWWLGCVLQAPAAPAAAQCAAALIEARIGAFAQELAVHITLSAGEADEELDGRAIPGSREPFVVPVPALAWARRGERLTVEWFSSGAPLAHVSVSMSDVLILGLAERRPPLTGPGAAGEPLVRRRQHVVVRIPELAVGLEVIDRYSGNALTEHARAALDDPIEPIYRTGRPLPGGSQGD